LKGSVEKARSLREQATRAEKILWSALRNRKIGGHKFRRQQPYGPYTLDFYCAEKRVAVELDGRGHAAIQQVEHDKTRSDYLRQEDVMVIRFWNSQIRENLEGVLKKIRMVLEEAPSPQPSPSRGEGV
jgi:type I restriction enzyme M protein